MKKRERFQQRPLREWANNDTRLVSSELQWLKGSRTVRAQHDPIPVLLLDADAAARRVLIHNTEAIVVLVTPAVYLRVPAFLVTSSCKRPAYHNENQCTQGKRATHIYRWR